MATYNGMQFIGQSINSLLTQTWRDFELIIADDCSTDDTGDILAGIRDPRVRVLRNPVNIGVVRSRNRCFNEARGAYVAMLDHDDLSQPTRLERQVAYLGSHPGVVLVGTDAHILDAGGLTRTKHPERTSPLLIKWLLHVANPLICSSVMFRTSAVRRLGTFMRAEYQYADDYDLYHRLAVLGDIARLDESLTIYRLHSTNTFRRHEDTMNANAVKVLTVAYKEWFGDDAEAAATLIVRHLAAGKPIQQADTLAKLQQYFERLHRSFLIQYNVDDTDRQAIKAHADELWRRVLRATARNGGFSRSESKPATPAALNYSLNDLAHLLLSRVPLEKRVRKHAREFLQRPVKPDVPLHSRRAFNTEFTPVTTDPNRPPTLFVVIDTEAEFDWAKPFARNLTHVTAMDDVERGQAVFDRYGLRPIYVVDFPVASQERSASRLRRILDRDGCFIGAHLHPWTTPPFLEQISNRNSFPGNLPPDLEEQKIISLIGAIRENLGVSPLFYKAGRYGFGNATAEILARHDIKVDLSVLPGADLRRNGGPDFRRFEPLPYMIGRRDILTVPMTRSHVGLAAPFGWISETMRHLPSLKWFRIQSILSRLRIVDTITLTPEGVTAAEQIRLIKTMLARGNRLFVMHYHSPSLTPGHTPYVNTTNEADNFIERMQDVCRYFFEEVGGLPGHPQDMVRMASRHAAPIG